MAEDLEALRAQLDAADRAVLEAAARRLALVRRVLDWKAEAGVPAQDPAREARVLARARAVGAELGLPEGVAEAVLRPLVGVGAVSGRDRSGA